MCVETIHRLTAGLVGSSVVCRRMAVAEVAAGVASALVDSYSSI